MKKQKSKAFKKIKAGLDDALRYAKGDESAAKLHRPQSELITNPDALMAALHLTVAHKALEEHVSDEGIELLCHVSDDIILYLKKALGLA